MPKAKVNEIELYYETSGSGDPLVLIAGLGYPLWQWHKMVPFLAEHFQVIAFDNRGVGQTDKPAGPYTAQMLAADTRVPQLRGIRWAVSSPKQWRLIIPKRSAH
jgi:pimeloyl-ACP methyl ester carboxylesterase